MISAAMYCDYKFSRVTRDGFQTFAVVKTYLGVYNDLLVDFSSINGYDVIPEQA